MKLIRIFILITLCSLSGCLGQNQHNNFEKLFEKGQALLKNGDIKKAYSTFDELIKLDSSRVEGYYGAGVAYSLLCNFDSTYCNEAIKLLSSAIYINPRYRRVHYNRGVCYFKKEAFYDALDDFNSAITYNPEDGSSYYNRSLTYLHLKDTLKSCQDFNIGKSLGVTVYEEYFEQFCK